MSLSVALTPIQLLAHHSLQVDLKTQKVEFQIFAWVLIQTEINYTKLCTAQLQLVLKTFIQYNYLMGFKDDMIWVQTLRVPTEMATFNTKGFVIWQRNPLKIFW